MDGLVLSPILTVMLLLAAGRVRRVRQAFARIRDRLKA